MRDQIAYRGIPLIIILFLSVSLLASEIHVEDAADSIPAFENLIFDDPSFQQSFRKQFQQALVYFPELGDIHIRIRCSDIATSMNSRPHIRAFVSRRKNREYLITVDTLDENRTGLFFRLSDSARIGLIGHELAHILDYHHHHLAGVAREGLEYLLHRARLEHRTDRIAIKHGLRNYLRRYAEASFDPAFAGIRYARFKKKYYYSSNELASIE
ncbi:MAG: hypothetical protein U0T82_11275 [Bacteroidales bacterium]